MAAEPSISESKSDAEFDEFADDYDAALNKGLSLTGESKEYYARGRLRWLRKRLDALEASSGNVLDFGCGTGGSTPYFFDALDAESVVGVDPSEESLEVARVDHSELNARFSTPEGFVGQGTIDLAFCNGVFHHIPIAERAAAVEFVFESLKPGGYFAFWENNAWNPATRFVMSRVPFDRDAILLWPRGARTLLRKAGFEIVLTDFLFVFPGMLRWLRWIEPMVCKLPAGGQYLVLARKPARDDQAGRRLRNAGMLD